MATSGSVDYTVNRTKIIDTALQLLNVLAAGETSSAEDYQLANDLLNMMVKSWQADGLHLWATQEATLFLQSGTGEYSLSSDASSAIATKSEGTVITAVSTAVAISDTAILVDSTTGMAAADLVGIVLDDGTVFQSTVASVDSSTQITIDDAVTGDGASVDNRVYVYTSRLNRPLRISSCRYVTGSGTTLREIPLTKVSKADYFNNPNKNSTGTPNSFYYDPQLTAGKLYLWPVPSNSTGYIRFTHERALEDFDSATDTPDFPQEWMETLLYNLATRLGPAFGRAGDPNFQVIAQIAVALKASSLDWDREVTNIRFEIED